MVLISHKYKYMFIHIPKTCGTTIRHSFPSDVSERDCSPLSPLCYSEYGHVSPKHYTYKEAIERYPHATKYFVFSVVRNPYDRLYSTFAYISAHRVKFSKYVIAIGLAAVGVSFAVFQNVAISQGVGLMFLIALLYMWHSLTHSFQTFVRSGFFLLKRLSPMVVMPQSAYTTGADSPFLIHEETFERDVRSLQSHFGLKHTVNTRNVINRGKAGKYKYLKHFLRAEVRMVNKVYSEDFKNFNYTPLDPDIFPITQ